LKKHRFDIVRNELIPVHDATLAKFDFGKSLNYSKNNEHYQISPQHDRSNMVRYGSHASIGYSACHTPTVGTAHEANRIFANIINSDLI